MKQFLKFITNEFDIGPNGTHVAMISYSTNAKVALAFNDPRGQQQTTVLKSIKALPHFRGFTFTDKALRLAEKSVFTEASGMRSNTQKVCFPKIISVPMLGPVGLVCARI